MTKIWLKLQLHFSQKTTTKTKLKSAVKINTALDELTQIDGWQLLRVLLPDLIMNYSRNMLIKHLLKLRNYYHLSK